MLRLRIENSSDFDFTKTRFWQFQQKTLHIFSHFKPVSQLISIPEVISEEALFRNCKKIKYTINRFIIWRTLNHVLPGKVFLVINRYYKELIYWG